jgi:hypothetical protein
MTYAGKAAGGTTAGCSVFVGIAGYLENPSLD